MRRFRLLLIPPVLWLATGIARIGPEERAVVRRFGAVAATPGPGLWIGWPWGIDRLDRVPIASVRRVRVGVRPDPSESPESALLLSGDQNLIAIAVNLDYSVAEGDAALVDYVLERERGEEILAREAEAAIAEWIAGQSVDEALLTGNAALGRRLGDVLPQRIERQHLGIRLLQVSVEALGPPESVRPAFEEVIRAQANIRAQEFRANQEADQKIRSARADEFRLGQEAGSYAENRTTLARAEAESFSARLDSYRRLRAQNPDIRALIWWDETGKLLANLKGRGGIDLLDRHIGPDGLDTTQWMKRAK